MKSLHILTLVSVGITLGGMVGFTTAVYTMPPAPIVHKIEVQRALLSCSKHDVLEYVRTCAAKRRMEIIAP